MALTFKGFSSKWNAHRHLLKHVARVVGWPRPALQAPDDPERWEELMGSTLPRILAERRLAVLDELRAVDRCRAGKHAPCTPNPCDECRDVSAVQAIETRLAAPLGKYESVAEAVFEWNRREGWRRLLVHRTEHGTAAEAYDDRYLFIAGTIADGTGELAVSTLYRKRSTPRALELELERNRASYEASGTLLNPASL
jgi:hypothetical protein